MSRMQPAQPDSSNTVDIGDFEVATVARREAAWRLSMSERLAQVHRLCKQMTALRGSARRP